MFRCFCIIFSMFTFLAFSSIAAANDQSSATSQTGTIVDTMDASGYTYLHLDTGAEKMWVAVPATEVVKGDKATFLGGMEMKDFYSKSLDKNFSSIIFSPGLAGKQGAGFHKASSTGTEPAASSFSDAVKAEGSASAAQPTPSQKTSGSTGAMMPMVEVKVEKADGENSYIVAEIFGKAEQLNGKPVRIRGKVVKFSPNIMGKNWIHLQDGSGDAMKNTHDLVVTSTSQTKLDDIIIIEGTVVTNKNFGFGYKYDVIVEEAVIKE